MEGPVLAARGARAGGAWTPSRLVHLHRHTLINVLVLGGTELERSQVACRFHGQSPLRLGPLVPVNCAREEPRLRSALQDWLATVNRVPGANPLRAAVHGTLFLDQVEALSSETQRLLLTLERHPGCEASDFEDRAWAGRLVVGNAEDLSIAVAEGRFSAALYDCIDKVRVELDPVPARGAA